MSRAVLLAMLAVGCLAGAGRAHAAPAGYPTETLADYVFGCMATNGQTEDAMRRCSCSIDYIAAQLELRRVRPGRDGAAHAAGSRRRWPGAMFRSSPWAQQMVEKLRRAQVEAEVRCF